MQNTIIENKQNIDMNFLELKPNEKLELCEEYYIIDNSYHSIERMSRISLIIGNVKNLNKRICYLLKEIEDFIVNEVRIGENIAIFDEVLQISFAINVDINVITIITVFDESQKNNGRTLKLYPNEKVVIIDATEISFYTFVKDQGRKKIELCD